MGINKSGVRMVNRVKTLFLVVILVSATGHAFACMVQLNKSVPIGDIILTVNYIHKGFTPGEEGAHSHASSGERMKVLVNLTVANEGSAPFEIRSSNFTMEDASGTRTGVIPAEGVETLGTLTISPGRSGSANLLFDVKGTKERFRLCYEPPGGAAQMVKIEL